MKFFEGDDFSENKFKALIPKYYPPKYKKYIKEEATLLKKRLKGARRILEAGVGIGRLIPLLAPRTGELVGVDNANLMLKESRAVAKKFSNVTIVKANLEELHQSFPKQYFDYSLCLWNTLGNVKDEAKVLRELSAVTSRSIFVTVYHKGTRKERIRWYAAVGIPLKKIDEKREIFHTKSGLVSKSYSLNEIKKIEKRAGLFVKDHKILGGVILWIELLHLPKKRNI